MLVATATGKTILTTLNDIDTENLSSYYDLKQLILAPTHLFFHFKCMYTDYIY